MTFEEALIHIGIAVGKADRQNETHLQIDRDAIEAVIDKTKAVCRHNKKMCCELSIRLCKKEI